MATKKQTFTPEEETAIRLETIDELMATANRPSRHPLMIVCIHVIDGAPVNLFVDETKGTKACVGNAMLMCRECADDKVTLWRSSARPVCSSHKIELANETARILMSVPPVAA